MNRAEVTNAESFREPVPGGTPRFLDAASIPPNAAISEGDAARLLGYGNSAPCPQLRDAASMGALAAMVVEDGAWMFLRAEVEMAAARQAAIRAGKSLFYSRQLT